MLTIVCDSCKKSIPSARRGTNYTAVLGKNLCRKCAKEIESQASERSRTDGRYSYKAFRKEYKTAIEEACR